MTTSSELPLTVDPGRFVRAQQAGQGITLATEESMTPVSFRDDHRLSVESDGQVFATRRGADTRQKVTGSMIADWCRRKQVGKIDGDVYGRLRTDDPAAADRVADQVAELARADAARDRRLTATTKSMARVAAERAISARTLFVVDGALWWAWSSAANPVTGRGVPGQPAAERPAPAGTPSALVAALRRQPTGTLVTVDVVRAAAQDARLIQAHETPPDWADVLAELRLMAGLPEAPAEVSAIGEGGPATRWFRSRAHRP